MLVNPALGAVFISVNIIGKYQAFVKCGKDFDGYNLMGCFTVSCLLPYRVTIGVMTGM